VVAWLLIQIVATVERPLNLPDWVDSFIIVVLAVGFPIAVILAWAFDLTPQGIKSASDEQVASAPGQSMGQRFSYISQALVLLAVGFLVVDQYVLNDARRSVDTGSSHTASQSVVRLTIVHPGAEPVQGATSDAKVAISPDGKHVAYLVGAVPFAELPLYVRALDRLEPALLSSSARSPFFSPDSQWVGFVEDNSQLSKVAVTGGPSVPIGKLNGSVRGASWGDDDTIIFATNDSSTGLLRIPAAGGNAETLTTPDTAKGEADHLYPDSLPGGRGVLFTITGPERIDNSQIALLDLATGEYRVLIRGGSFANYSESGHIIYGVEGTLRAVPFDLKRLEVTGNPVPVLDGVVTDDSGSAAFNLAPNGTLVYLMGSGDVLSRTLVSVDRDGREEPLAADAQRYFHPRLSPDGQRLALAVASSRLEADIWIYDLLRGTMSRLTFDPARDVNPGWTPDGERVFFTSNRDGGGIYSKAADGTGQVEALLTGQGEIFARFFTPDRDRLVVEKRVDGWDIHIVSMTDGTTNALIGGQGNQQFASLSPDGRWIAYDSDESGRSEIYVRPFPVVDAGKWQVSRSGGRQPQWGPGSRELFFLGPDAMMAIDIESEPAFSLGAPKRLFPTAGYTEFFRSGSGLYSAWPDGQHFVMIKVAAGTDSEGAAEQYSLAVVLNWFEELKRLAPATE
jgi:dipeptidyl aminopeptidase/acylaminoacyl peptidase